MLGGVVTAADADSASVFDLARNVLGNPYKSAADDDAASAPAPEPDDAAVPLPGDDTYRADARAPARVASEGSVVRRPHRPGTGPGARQEGDVMEVRDKLYIGGAWVPSTGKGVIEVINSTTEEVIGTIPEGTPEDVDRAARAAATPSCRGRRRRETSEPRRWRACKRR